MPGPDPTPVAGGEAYTRRDRNARLSQAAIVLSLGAAAAGQPERVDRPDAVGLPADLAPLGQREPVPLEEAVAPLGITADEQRSRSVPAAAAPNDRTIAAWLSRASRSRRVYACAPATGVGSGPGMALQGSAGSPIEVRC